MKVVLTITAKVNPLMAPAVRAMLIAFSDDVVTERLKEQVSKSLPPGMSIESAKLREEK